ncbi:MAG: glycosyltransferase [Syntrophobacteraceae bacterium]
MRTKLLPQSIRNRIYYNVRPLIPRNLQIALRRFIASRKLRLCHGVWPVDPASGAVPVGWPGWPDDKRFALVLTHDVETFNGHAKCLDLAALERALGFRSGFNFVAERYPVSSELRNYLVANGFEVGLHGLYHDGKKFKSRRIFNERVPKINKYLKEWNAAGFRSPAMQCRLEWLHDLDIRYDCSTYDTDPFEPQFGAVSTIFPFYVYDKRGRTGFVELPYTLPQDFTLFVILKQENIDIWKQKLDWIAERGGMALILTHPDYMNFGNNPESDEYPATRYRDFLEYVKEKYEGQFWNALPGEVAGYCEKGCKNLAPKAARPLRVCMPVYSFYENDNRVIRYAETLVRRGDQVDVLSLRKEMQPFYENLNGVHVHRIQGRIRNERNKLSYLLRLLKFFVKSGFFITKFHLRQSYDLLHVHSVPDFEVFAALVPKLTGARVILDIHDIVPEFYASKFGSSSKSALFKLLLAVEKISASFSDHVIISNHLWRETLVERSVPESKCTVILNYPDPRVFLKREKSRIDGKKIVMYPGTLNYHQGLDIAILAFSRISGELPEAELHIYGGGDQLDSLMNLSAQLALDGRVKFFGTVPIYEIANVMANSDLGIVPKRSNSFGNEAFSTKVLEFMSLGVPVLVSSTRIDQFYFNDDVVHFFKAQDEDDLADKLLFLLTNESFRMTLSASALAFAQDFSWDLKKTKYLDLVDSLTVSIR